MNNKLLVSLFFVSIVYIGIGGVIFHFLESPRDVQARASVLEFLGAFRSNFTCVPDEHLMGLVSVIQEASSKNIEIIGLNQTHGVNWDYSTSIFFSFTVVTTIGYGHITPSTVGTQVFCAFYSFIGIPLFLVTCAGIGDKLRVATNKIEAKLSPKTKSKWIKAGLSLLLFAFGFLLFAFVPAAIFQAMESWSMASSLYFVWITLTTIGFGDLVPGQQDAAHLSYNSMYRIAIIFWIFIGLTWMAGVITTVQDIFSEAASKVQKVVQNEDDQEEKLQQDDSEKVKDQEV